MVSVAGRGEGGRVCDEARVRCGGGGVACELAQRVRCGQHRAGVWGPTAEGRGSS